MSKKAKLTKREYFAVLAMQAIRANESDSKFFDENVNDGAYDAWVAQEAVDQADALIIALKNLDDLNG